MSDAGEVRAAVESAYQLHRNGSLEAALAALDRILSTVDPEGTCPSDDVAGVASVYAGMLVAHGRLDAAVLWARCAHRSLTAYREFWTPHAMRAAAIIAHVAARGGDHAQAASCYAELLGRMRAWYGPSHRETLACQADLAVAMHAAVTAQGVGDCREARRLLGEAYADHRASSGPDRAALRMLTRLAVMTRECGDFDVAHRQFREARDLARIYLDRADPLAVAITRAARDGRTTRHVCVPGPLD